MNKAGPIPFTALQSYPQIPKRGGGGGKLDGGGSELPQDSVTLGEAAPTKPKGKSLLKTIILGVAGAAALATGVGLAAAGAAVSPIIGVGL